MFRKILRTKAILAGLAGAFVTATAQAGPAEPVIPAYIFPGVGTLAEILMSLLR